MDADLIRELAQPADTKILLLVLDGLGGLPERPSGATPLEAAHTPHLDALAAEGECGLHLPIGEGITPGSGPAHLALFGYPAQHHRVGRGVLAALGIDFPLENGDIAARGNFCTLDADGCVTDRRAGRIGNDECERLCANLQGIRAGEISFEVKPVKGHRFLLVARGPQLFADLADTDPHATGELPREPAPETPAAEAAADALRTFLEEAHQRLENESQANGLLLRGFDQMPDIPPLPEVTGMRCRAVAAYPMYRGVSRLLGMEATEVVDDPAAEFTAVKTAWPEADFFFVHIKKTDAYGEDGDFDAKRKLIEAVDTHIPTLRALHPDVFLVTGDHSTPATLKAHSWHPVPTLLHAPRAQRPDGVTTFGEKACLAGSLGPRFPAPELMPLALGYAGRLRKFGA